LSELNSEPPVAVDVPFEIVGKPKVFLSYGRKDALEVAQRLESDLVAAGYEVWMDVKKIGSGSQWQQEIEEGLRQSHVVVSLLSPHAVRKVGEDVMDSVCLDELTFARTSSPPTPVVPAMVVPCEPPFIIYRLDYVHLTGWKDSDESYRLGFERLISGIRDALSGKVRYRLWEDRLRPLDFSDYLAQKRRGFVGREWLFEEIDLWRFHSEERALLITGDPGAGKSSIVAQLAHLNPDGQVIAYHCCQSNELETLRPAKFVQSLAAMIASRLPAYAEQLEVPIVKEALEDNRCDDDAGGAFLVGILQPLQKLAAPDDGVRYILVDALDEALCHTGTNTIVDILASRLERLPSWLRIVATTRNEAGVIQRLSGLRAKSIDATDPRNLNDVATYIRQRLDEPALAERRVESRKSVDAIVRLISQNSSGNFLYAANALDGIARDFYSFAHLDALPRGLDGIYLDFFRRIFGHEGSEAGEVAYKRAKPFLQVLCASVEPLSRKELATASNLDPEEDLPQLLRRLAQLLSRRSRGNREETIAFYHKSVADWLVGNPDVNAFAVSPAKGRKLLADFCRATLSQGRAKPCWYVRRHAVEHFLEVEDWDSVAATLSDLEFIEARAIAQELPEMLHDYALARDLLPERDHSRKKAEELRSANDRFTRELIAYSDTWSRIREGSSEVMPQLPRPVGVAPLITSDQIVAERMRIHDFPNRLDRVTDFWKFCATHIKHLSKNSCQQGYVSNTAYNFSPAGPVHAAGARFMQKSEDIKIQRNIDQEYYNPLDPFCGDLEMLQQSPCLAMTPNGKRAVAGDSLHRLWVWDLEKRYCIKILGEEKKYLYASDRNHALAMTPCGSRVVSVGWKQELRVWDIESGKCIKELVSGKGTVFALAITSCGRRVVSCTGCDREEGNFFQVWDIESGCCVKEVFLYSTTYAVAVSPCGTHALVGSCPGFNYVITKINLDLTEDGYECYEQMTEFALVDKENKGSNHRGHVRSMAITPCGTRLISGSEDSKVRVWDLVNGKCLNILEGHESWVKSVAVTPCGRRAISGEQGGTLRVWDLKSGECLRVIVGSDPIHCLALTACGSLAISGHSRGMRIWDVTVGDRINDHMNGSSYISHMALAPNGKHVATLQVCNKVKLWDAKTGLCSSLAELRDLPPCRGFAMSPCGERVIFGGYDRLGFLNLVGNPIIDIAKFADSSVMSLNVTPCERFIITLGLDQKLNIWDAKEFQLLEQKTQTFHEVSNLLAISPCGRFIVMGTSIKNSKDTLSLHLCDLTSWQLINVFKGHKDSLNEIAFTPCGRFIIAASDDNALHVWDAFSGVTLFELTGHIGPCSSIALTPCGKRVVSACKWEDAIRVWDLDTGKQLSVFKVDRPSKILIKSDIVAIASGHEVFIARHHNLINGPLITTAIKMSSSQDRGSARVNARTPCCAKVISIPEAIADRIEQWTNESGNGGYTDPILLLDCRSCGKPLRMNPFFVDVKPIKK
jgi:WD40 repeat protein